MLRVSQPLLYQQVERNAQKHASQFIQWQRRLSSQQNIKFPHEKPLEMEPLLRYKNNLQHLSRYADNLRAGVGFVRFTETKINEVLQTTQRLRELTVQAANGVLTKQDRLNLALETESALRQIIQVANSTFRGESIFSGHQTQSQAYVVKMGHDSVMGRPMVTQVDYHGDSGAKLAEIKKGFFMNLNLNGHSVFRGSNQRITSQTDSTGYLALPGEKSLTHHIIRVDGNNIQIDNGDSIDIITEKINASPASIRAYVDNSSGHNFLVLETTSPHEIVLEDIQGSIFQDLGIIASGFPNASNNISPETIVEGKNLFEHIIGLRDALLQNNINQINQNLGFLDECLETLTKNIAITGIRQKKMNLILDQTLLVREQTLKLHEEIQGVDLPKAISKLKNTELAHQLALQSIAKAFQWTLLDFLK